MHKSALLLAVVFAATAPSLALAKKAKRVHAAPAPVVESSPSDNGRFFHDAFHQIFVPAETIFSGPRAEPVPAPVRVRHARRHHRHAA
jgi:hypothetical protein